ncbi:sphingomyelin phosphodiesterase-like [Trichogramma pretiosum]|uniref:sphingomyelin phosphodiesterase-like n=1 Tax=Trichogramma pretiosum TaxID=7493 RepID=UPI000C719C71|nr:sphingomyelin phosphodiesterase-like [Trichogramma pretiosum]
MRILQLNLIHCEAAQDLLCDTISKLRIDVAILCEQYKNLAPPNTWLADADGQAAIWVQGGIPVQERPARVYPYFSWARIGGIFFFSVYAPPRLSGTEFSALLANISEEARGKRPLVIAGDFNACLQLSIPIPRTQPSKSPRCLRKDIDYIIWTGDLPPHDVWNQTREENLRILRETVKQMVGHFPGIPIFPAIGNHESAPVNSFPTSFSPSDTSISWLYNELDKEWQRWLPVGSSPTVRQGAFYSVLIRPGFRIVSINTNYCNNKNWWLLINSTDPVNELQWLVYELQAAEMNNEKVHIIGHIPPGHSDCLKVWSRNYYHIINRYESTITAQFFGHTHYDEFQIFYDTNDLGRALSIAYIGPSVSPYYDLNPGYRIYYVDGDHPKTTRLVLDHESWVMNLKEANLYDYPVWYKLYSVKQTYQMSSLLPKDWDSLIDKMLNEPNMFDTYYRNYFKNSPVRPSCADDCKKRLLCDLRCGKSHDRKALCQTLEARIDNTSKTGWRAWIYNGLALSMSVVMAIPRFAYNLPKYVFGSR